MPMRSWWRGNVGYRRPQIRLTRTASLASDVELKIDAGITDALLKDQT
jgi:hypothetical protein